MKIHCHFNNVVPFLDKFMIINQIFTLNMSTINEFFDKVLLINLKSRPDRLKNTKVFLDKYNIEYELIEAVDGNSDKQVAEIYNKVSKNPLRSFERNGKVVTKGKIGCLMSHLKCYKMIRDNDWDRTLILEDDVLFCNNFDNRIKILFDIPDNWGILYLGASDYRHKANKERLLSHGLKGFYYGYGAAGRFAYGIKKDFINIILQQYEDQSQWDIPGDVILKRAQGYRKCAFLNPNLIIADVRDSDLRTYRDIKKHSGRIGWDLSLFNLGKEDDIDPVKVFEERKSAFNQYPHYHDVISGWFDFDDIYSEAINRVNKKAKFVEVGSFKGKSTSFMAIEILKSGKDISFDAVDNFQGSTGMNVLPDDLFNEFTHNISPIKDLVTLNRKPSLEAAKDYKNNSIDFFFLDASHDEESVLNDLNVWWPKIKKGGMMAGHDYTDKWPGVTKAVDELFPQRIIARNSWVVEK